MKKNNILKMKLENIMKLEGATIKREVIDEALKYDTDNDIKSFFTDLASGGCVSGMVDRLIYYIDTHSFYEEHYDEIEKLRVECLNNTGSDIEVGDQDLKNKYA